LSTGADWNLALAAFLVFARPPLTQYLEEQQKPYISWNDFIDVRNQLSNYLKSSLALDKKRRSTLKFPCKSKK
jgi:2-hydroxy-3-keto-5-methylthiopentenyl-1-phosphate phosphatase